MDKLADLTVKYGLLSAKCSKDLLINLNIGNVDCVKVRNMKNIT